jgi:hypothetical protein
MKTPIGYGKNMFGELKEYFTDDLDEEELEYLNNMGLVIRENYSEKYVIYSSKEKFKESVKKEYDDYISRLEFQIKSTKETLGIYKSKLKELENF